MANTPYIPSSEYLGRKRFPDNQAWRNRLTTVSRDILFTLQNLMASNYPLESSTNIGDLFRIVSREIARINMGLEQISGDAFYETTRTPYLQQVLGERLFLNSRIAPADYNDSSYRDYLISIKNAFLHGSTKANLEALATHFTGMQVRIKELYLEARTPGSSVGIINTHKMLVQVFIDEALQAGYDINSLKDKLDFFINLTRPAHVLYDTNLIWTELIDTNKKHDLIYGDTGGGCIPHYDVIPFVDTYAARIISVLPSATGATGQIISLVPLDKIFFINTGARIIVEPGVEGTKIFNVSGHRVDFTGLAVGQYVKIASLEIAGEFQFWYTPDFMVGTSYYEQFYKSNYQRPAFQENVKKIMDSHGRFSDQTKTTGSTLCDRWVLDPLEPLYEDLRKPCFAGKGQGGVYSSELQDRMGFPRQTWPYDRNSITDLELLGDNYIVFLPNTPVTDSSYAIGFQLDGTAMTGAITGMDATSGRIELNTAHSFWDSSAHTPIPGDELTFNYRYLGLNSDSDKTTSVILGPDTTAEISDSDIYPDTTAIIFQPDNFLLSHIPTDGNGGPAKASDIDVIFESVTVPGAVLGVNVDGRVWLNGSSNFWDASAPRRPIPGDTLTFAYKNSTDSTNYSDATTKLVFGIGHWQMPHAPLVSDSSGTLAGLTDIGLTVDGTTITGAVTLVRPLVGHINLNEQSSFWTASALGRLPRVGDTFRFDYTWGEMYTYPMLFDDSERVFDTYTGGYSTYSMVFDGGADSTAGSSMSSPEPTTIGYRFRTYLLHHSCVLNSPDTLNFNTYQKPANRASIINQHQTLNRFNEVWSAEHLYDKNPLSELNDAYLENGLDPVIRLNQGTPPFQKTFSYQPDQIYQRKVQDIRTHHHPLIYTDMLLKEFPEGDGAPISSICDSAKVSFATKMEDTLDPIKECDPWILFDTADSTSLLVNIPGGFVGVPNLRIVDKHLRENFILRELQPSGIATYTYSITTTEDSTSMTEFMMPQSFRVLTEYGEVQFPALPMMHDASSVATYLDVTVKIDGSPWPVVAVNPYTGYVQLATFPTAVVTEHVFTLSELDVARASILLPGVPIDPENITLTIVHGTSQYYGYDFYIEGRYLTWYGTSLDHLIEVGDQLRVSYAVNPLLAATLVFTYKILSSAVIEVSSEDTRILDNGYVFGGPCFDGGMKPVAEWKLEEYLAGLSDYSEGIKLNYFSPRTSSIETNVFSGPVFESYEAVEDEIGVPSQFPDAILRIKGPVGGNPLRAASDYGVLSDKLVRFRKTTYHELLPDHTFRKLKLTEIVPV